MAGCCAEGSSVDLVLIHGQSKKSITVCVPTEDAGDPCSVKHLSDVVKDITDIPTKNQKLIFKGKSLANPEQNLFSLGIRSGSKIMLIGKRHNPEEDENFKTLLSIERSMEKLEKKHGEITHDLDGIHRGFLEIDLRGKALIKLDKHLVLLAEDFMKLLESIDSVQLSDDHKEGRAKRKSLVQKIQTRLKELDGLAAGVKDMLTRA